LNVLGCFRVVKEEGRRRRRRRYTRNTKEGN
jgi:hypothetical protein